mgnify:CR=1
MAFYIGGGVSSGYVKIFCFKSLNYYLKNAQNGKIPLKVIRITDKSSARNAPSPVTTYALFHNGKFITHAIQSDKKFLKLAGGGTGEIKSFPVV